MTTENLNELITKSNNFVDKALEDVQKVQAKQQQIIESETQKLHDSLDQVFTRIKDYTVDDICNVGFGIYKIEPPNSELNPAYSIIGVKYFGSRSDIPYIIPSNTVFHLIEGDGAEADIFNTKFSQRGFSYMSKLGDLGLLIHIDPVANKKVVSYHVHVDGCSCVCNVHTTDPNSLINANVIFNKPTESLDEIAGEDSSIANLFKNTSKKFENDWINNNLKTKTRKSILLHILNQLSETKDLNYVKKILTLNKNICHGV